MAKEIERKFLVKDDSFRSLASEIHSIEQAYLSTTPEATVRVRIFDDSAWLTVKGRNQGAVRDEWEYQIPIEDARQMIEGCTGGKIIRKRRYRVGRWEVDEFSGSLQGLIVAEIELNSPGEQVELPDFIGREVTDDPRYYNSTLSTTFTIPD